MAPVQIFPDVYALALGVVNVFFIRDGDGLALIDTGNPGNEQLILDGARALGAAPQGIRHIALTHCHPDHAGSLAALARVTGARVWMHHDDAEVVRGNSPMVRSKPSPGLLNALLYRLFINSVPATVPVAQVDHEIGDGELLPIGGGLRVYHTPGHSAGHVAFLLERDGGLLFAGDACANLPVLAYSIVYDDIAEGRRSLARLAGLNFAAVCFGHGGLLRGEAARRFNRKWA